MNNMSKLPADNYEVGYGKPPQKTQFKKGHSGNPKGRPRGAKSKPKLLTNEGLKKVILEEAYREIRVNEEHGPVTMPLAQAVIRSISVKAAKGDHKSQKLLTDLVGRTEEQETALHNRIMETTIDYIKEADFELERRKRLGDTGPDIIPHPEDIILDEDTGLPFIAGPLTYAHKREFEKTYEAIQFLQENTAKAETALEGELNKEERAELEEVIHIGRDAIRELDEKIHGWRPKD
jgi:hypothetical protein